ncbi:MAG: carbohydrate-binding family 6 protein [Saprospiraceae bacterium]
MKIAQAPLLNPFIPLMCSALCLFSCSTKQADIKISGELAPPPVQFALQELTSAIQLAGKGVLQLENNDSKADITFVIRSDDERLKPEGFSIEKVGGTIKVIGADVAGAMYGGMELAEQIRLFGLAGVEATLQNPYMERRGTKFNIPLDMRSPSYSDASDAAQKNIPTMWDFSFWQGYIDNLARYRYNFISLWSLHPFPSMVKVPDYPDIALQDVQRSTVDWQEYYHLHGTGLDAPDILANPQTVKQMSIEEKMAFWQKVMKYGKDHNVDFYVVTWNIFVNGTAGQYGITDAIDNPITRDYFRKSVKQMFVTYPDLAGIGLTTGENMGDAGFEEKEDWAFETYAQGVLDAAEEMPDRHFTFIHRQHQAGALAIAEKFKPLRDRDNIEFLFSFKYAAAHVFSATQQHFHQKFVEDIKGMKTIWTLRNDDVYHFRWGAPDFVREFISNIPHEVSRGIYYGSDQWVWGREFLMKDPETPRQLEIVKHWYHWMLWGRLGYNPQLSNERFIQILQDHYPGVAAEKLFAAWQDASMIYPITTGFHWGPLDFQWYIEACKSRPAYAQNETGFHDVNRFISLPPHPKSGFQSIPDFVAMTTSNGSSELSSPLAVATQLHATADKALLNLETLAAGENKALQATLQDIRTMAYLGKYYAHKIAGATQLALYRKTQDQTYQDQALTELTQALSYWEKYTAAAMTQNINPLWTNRVGYVDWIQITEWVKGDIEIAKAG